MSGCPWLSADHGVTLDDQSIFALVTSRARCHDISSMLSQCKLAVRFWILMSTIFLMCSLMCCLRNFISFCMHMFDCYINPSQYKSDLTYFNWFHLNWIFFNTWINTHNNITRPTRIASIQTLKNMWSKLSRQKVLSNLEGSQEFVSELSSFLSVNVRNSPSSHHHFRGIKLLKPKTLGVSNPPRANVLLLDKNEPMICDNSLDLLLENDPKKIIALDQWCRINCPGDHFIPLTFSSAVQLQITVSLTVKPQILWTKTGESEYSQEMVEMSFWESRKFPRHILKPFHFQLCKLWDIYKISCIRLYAETKMYICRSDQAKFVQDSYELLNPFF